MFYQILLFVPLKLWSGLFFFLFLSFTAFFSFSSSPEVEEGSLVSGGVCLRTPPEGAALADSDTNRFIKAGPEPSAPPRQSDEWWEDAEPAGAAAGPPVWERSWLMDRDVHPASPLARSLAHLRILLHSSLLLPASSCAPPQAGCL